MIRFVTLFARDIERTAEIYRLLSSDFVQEQHGDEPPHLACVTEKVVLEIYPGESAASPGIMIGFSVPNLNDVRSKILEPGFTVLKNIQADTGMHRMIVTDPEGRRIFIGAAT